MNVHVAVLTIGQLAKAAGVSTPTIRYYEEIGLLPKAGRSAAGQRMQRRRTDRARARVVTHPRADRYR